MIRQLVFKFLTSGLSSTSKAPTDQASLPFEEPVSIFKPLFPVGAIVMQTWSWIGNCQSAYLYFQVRETNIRLQLMRQSLVHQHPKWTEKQVSDELTIQVRDLRIRNEERKKKGFRVYGVDSYQYLCEAVPYGFRMGSRNWFEEDKLIDTGLRWEVPTDEQLDGWCRKMHPHPPDAISRENATGPTGYDRWFLSTYHTPINGQDTPRPEKLERYHYDNRPFLGERELVKKLESLNPRVYPRWDKHVSRGRYDSMISTILEKKR